ncbi:hypothetical protein E6C27_scaffold243G005000 [Cucumis melo var. makuwa]|uniref:Uncharacterized protein n=1 Tax=Cucumis melo var. makuwa TaxID=1194695 RepID=A0A5A7TRC8_CUCMM|nr:hypothetical protein E6C27_scaffold243G005000 [Cucumis melo var. makuwa]
MSCLCQCQCQTGNPVRLRSHKCEQPRRVSPSSLCHNSSDPEDTHVAGSAEEAKIDWRLGWNSAHREVRRRGRSFRVGWQRGASVRGCGSGGDTTWVVEARARLGLANFDGRCLLSTDGARFRRTVTAGRVTGQRSELVTVADGSDRERRNAAAGSTVCSSRPHPFPISFQPHATIDPSAASVPTAVDIPFYVDPLSVDSNEGHNQVSGKGFSTTGPRIEAGNVVIHRGLHVSNVTASGSLCAIGCRYVVVYCLDIDHGVLSWKDCVSFGITRLIRASFGITRLICASFGITRLICASFGITRLICASFGITRLIGVSFGVTRLIRASFGITRLMCAFYRTTRLLRRVRVQRGADQREAGRMREGHMDASGFLYASTDIFC